MAALFDRAYYCLWSLAILAKIKDRSSEAVVHSMRMAIAALGLVSSLGVKFPGATHQATSRL